MLVSKWQLVAVMKLYHLFQHLFQLSTNSVWTRKTPKQKFFLVICFVSALFCLVTKKKWNVLLSSELKVLFCLLHLQDLDLRMEHFHCYSNHGDGGHYHYDTTPNEVEYRGYFNIAEYMFRIDKPLETHAIGRDWELVGLHELTLTDISAIFTEIQHCRQNAIQVCTYLLKKCLSMDCFKYMFFHWIEVDWSYDYSVHSYVYMHMVFTCLFKVYLLNYIWRCNWYIYIYI